MLCLAPAFHGLPLALCGHSLHVLEVLASTAGCCSTALRHATRSMPCGHLLQVVEVLPPRLQGRPFTPSVGVDPAQPSTLWPYQQVLAAAQVLRVRCPLIHVKFNTPVGLRQAACSSSLHAPTHPGMLWP